MDDTHLPHAHSHNSTFFGVLRIYANVRGSKQQLAF